SISSSSSSLLLPPPSSPLFPYTTLFRSASTTAASCSICAASSTPPSSTSSSDMPLIIGTAGHIDHGKTSLIRALTGQDTDRLKEDRKSTRLNSSHRTISYAVFCLKKKKQ